MAALPRPNVKLRPIAESDAPMLSQWLSSSRIASTIPSLDKKHLREKAAWIDLAKSEQYKIHVIEADGTPAGISVLYALDRSKETACTGIVIFEHDMQGKGIGNTAKHLQLDFAFDHLGLKQVHSFVMQDNTRIRDGLSGFGYRNAEPSSGGRHKLTLTRERWNEIRRSHTSDPKART